MTYLPNILSIAALVQYDLCTHQNINFAIFYRTDQITKGMLAASGIQIHTFYDFEPGIHYTQFQMQSGYTGVNTIRIYNPIKQSFDQDPKGEFIKQWLPELKGLPLPHLHEPWAIPPMMWEMEQWNIGAYPKHPIVDLSSARKHASDQLYGIKKTKASKLEAQLILEKLVNPRAKKS